MRNGVDLDRLDGNYPAISAKPIAGKNEKGNRGSKDSCGNQQCTLLISSHGKRAESPNSEFRESEETGGKGENVA